MLYRSTNCTVYSAKYHLVWCPKYRRRVLVEVPPTAALSGFVKALKGRSSRLLRQEFPQLRRMRSLWAPSWFVSTVGGAPLEVVRRYVENQKKVAV